jgi:hypothetical protein
MLEDVPFRIVRVRNALYPGYHVFLIEIYILSYAKRIITLLLPRIAQC